MSDSMPKPFERYLSPDKRLYEVVGLTQEPIWDGDEETNRWIPGLKKVVFQDLITGQIRELTSIEGWCKVDGNTIV